jgi:hypothetical protein
VGQFDARSPSATVAAWQRTGSSGLLC